jgi:hypothetical protein
MEGSEGDCHCLRLARNCDPVVVLDTRQLVKVGLTTNVSYRVRRMPPFV